MERKTQPFERNEFQNRFSYFSGQTFYHLHRVGVHITLNITPHDIAPEAWESAFEETLRLLRTHPSGLIGSDTTEVRGRTLSVYTGDIERGPKTEAHRWCVIGDRESLRTAEPQSLYRDLKQYARNTRGLSDEILMQI